MESTNVLTDDSLDTPERSSSMPPQIPTQTRAVSPDTKFCKFCGDKIPSDAVICCHCGRQVEQLAQAPQAQPSVIINNTNTNTNTNKNINTLQGGIGVRKNKWIALLLCLLLGYWGAHRFYEGSFLVGLIYIFTFGLFGFGILFDLIRLLFYPSTYYVIRGKRVA